MKEAKEQLWQAYTSKEIRAEALFAGLKLIESRFTTIRNLRQGEVRVILDTVSALGLITGDTRQLCLQRRK